MQFFSNVVDTIVNYYKNPFIDKSFANLLETHPEFSFLFNRSYRGNFFRSSDIFFVWFECVNKKDKNDVNDCYVGVSKADASITEVKIGHELKFNPVNIHELYILLSNCNNNPLYPYYFNTTPLECVINNHTTDEVIGWQIIYFVKNELESYDEINLNKFTNDVKAYYNISDEGLRFKLGRLNGYQISK